MKFGRPASVGTGAVDEAVGAGQSVVRPISFLFFLVRPFTGRWFFFNGSFLWFRRRGLLEGTALRLAVQDAVHHQEVGMILEGAPVVTVFFFAV